MAKSAAALARKQAKAAAKAATQSSPANEGGTNGSTALATQLQAPSDRLQVDNNPTVIRPLNTLSQLVTYRDDIAMLTPDSKLNVLELAEIAKQYARESESAQMRCVTTLNLTRGLPDVEETRPDGNGTFKRPAFQVACEIVEKGCQTTSTWGNLKGLFQVIEIANTLDMNVYRAKNAKAYLERLGHLVEKDGKLALKEGAMKDEGVKLIMGDAVGNNELVKQLAPIKAKHNALADAEKREIPFKREWKKAQAAAAKAAPKLKDKAQEEKVDGGVISRAIQSVSGLYQKAVDAAPKDKVQETVDAIRAECAEEFAKLALLMGKKCK